MPSRILPDLGTQSGQRKTTGGKSNPITEPGCLFNFSAFVGFRHLSQRKVSGGRGMGHLTVDDIKHLVVGVQGSTTKSARRMMSPTPSNGRPLLVSLVWWNLKAMSGLLGNWGVSDNAVRKHLRRLDN